MGPKFILVKCGLVTAMLVAIYLHGTFVMGIHNEMVYWNMAIAGLLASRMFLAGLMLVGHGVSGMRHIIGMPVIMFFFNVTFLWFAVFFITVKIDVSGLGGAEANIHSMGWAALFGIGACILDWYLVSYQVTYHRSEVFERMRLKKESRSPKEIERRIAYMRHQGILAPIRQR